jgi:hypothetical protein
LQNLGRKFGSLNNPIPGFWPIIALFFLLLPYRQIVSPTLWSLLAPYTQPAGDASTWSNVNCVPTAGSERLFLIKSVSCKKEICCGHFEKTRDRVDDNLGFSRDRICRMREG